MTNKEEPEECKHTITYSLETETQKNIGCLTCGKIISNEKNTTKTERENS